MNVSIHTQPESDDNYPDAYRRDILAQLRTTRNEHEAYTLMLLLARHDAMVAATGDMTPAVYR